MHQYITHSWKTHVRYVFGPKALGLKPMYPSSLLYMKVLAKNWNWGMKQNSLICRTSLHKLATSLVTCGFSSSGKGCGLECGLLPAISEYPFRIVVHSPRNAMECIVKSLFFFEQEYIVKSLAYVFTSTPEIPNIDKHFPFLLQEFQTKLFHWIACCASCCYKHHLPPSTECWHRPVCHDSHVNLTNEMEICVWEKKENKDRHTQLQRQTKKHQSISCSSHLLIDNNVVKVFQSMSNPLWQPRKPALQPSNIIQNENSPTWTISRKHEKTFIDPTNINKNQNSLCTRPEYDPWSKNIRGKNAEGSKGFRGSFSARPFT